MSHNSNGQPTENKTIISFKNSFWLVVIIVGLFVAALNFIQAENGNEEGKEKTEMTEKKAGGEKTEAKSEQKAEEPKPTEPTAKDTAKAGK